jgi:hypothetical protein
LVQQVRAAARATGTLGPPLPWSKSWVLPNASIEVINVSSPTITEESTCKRVEDDATLMKLSSEFLLLILNKLDPYCLNYTFDSHV